MTQPNLHVRITRRYEDLSGVFLQWSDKCADMIVVEHEPQKHEKDKRIHCHILLVNPTVQNEQLQKPLRKMQLAGNTDFYFNTKVASGKFKGKPIERDLTATYMIKGRYAVNFSKNFSKEEMEAFRLSWVDSDLENSKLPVATKSRDDVEWNHLLTTYENLKEPKTMIGIRRWIKSDCLRRRKPIPRSSDVNRWAYSIYAITNNLISEQHVQEVDEYAREQEIQVD